MVIIEDIMPTHIHTRAFAYVRVCMYVRVFFSFCLFSGLLHFFLSFFLGWGRGVGGGGESGARLFCAVVRTSLKQYFV